MEETNEIVEKEERKIQIKDSSDGEFRDLTGTETAELIAALATPIVLAFVIGVASSDKVKNGYCKAKSFVGNLFKKKVKPDFEVIDNREK